MLYALSQRPQTCLLGKESLSPIFVISGEQGWCSGESTHLPPVWPGLDSWSRRHMWVEFVAGPRPCSKRFFSGYSSFPLSSKTNISKFHVLKKSTFVLSAKLKLRV